MTDCISFDEKGHDPSVAPTRVLMKGSSPHGGQRGIRAATE